MCKLGVNIDHIATLRQLRRSRFPDLVQAARTCESAGADSIVVHLREDRRHIQDVDVRRLRQSVTTRLNMEMSVAPDILRIACRLKPDQCTLVPEKRQELTTEGGLDVLRFGRAITKAVDGLRRREISVSLFIEPDHRHIKVAKELGAGMIELHTGQYANSKNVREMRKNLAVFREAAGYAHHLGLVVNAGHGLDYHNVCPVASSDDIYELNIGYAIVCQAVFVGLENAVRQMKRLMQKP